MVLSLPIFWLATMLFEYPFSISAFFESWLGTLYMRIAVNALAQLNVRVASRREIITFVVRAELFRRYSANTVSTFLFIAPVIGLVFGHWFLGEPLTWTVGLGSAIVSWGVFLVYRYT